MKRTDAIKKGLKTYTSLCKKCSCTERYVSSYGCVQCTIARNDNEYIKQYSKTEKAKNRTKQYMGDYKADGKISENQKKYQQSTKGQEKYKKYYAENKDVWFKSNLKKYNITLDEYYDLLTKQNRCCAICSISEAELNKKMHIDHNHTTGEVRGLLCHHCNTGIGLFKENILVMKKAMEYLNG